MSQTLMDTLFEPVRLPVAEVVTSFWHSKKKQLTYQPKPGDPALGFDGSPIPQSRFETRLIIPLSSIYRGHNPARQEASTEAANAARVYTSFKERGFVPSDCGQGVIVYRIPINERLDKHSPYYGKEFGLNAGFHRCEGHEKMGKEDGLWNYIIADVYEYDTPLARRVHAGVTNCHYSYRAPSNTNDIRQQLENALAAGHLKNDKADITDFIDRIAAHMPSKTRQTIVQGALKKIPSQLYGGYMLRSLTSDIPQADRLTDIKSTHYAAILMDLPVEFGNGKGRVVKPNSYGDIQTFFSDEGSVQRAFTSGVESWYREGCPVNRYVYVALYVNTAHLRETHNNPTALRDKRQALWKKAKGQLNSYYKIRTSQYRQFLLDHDLPMLSDKEIMEYVIKTCPVILAGFLPQVENPNPENGGVAVETTMVDWKGNPYDYKTTIGR